MYDKLGMSIQYSKFEFTTDKKNKLQKPWTKILRIVNVGSV